MERRIEGGREAGREREERFGILDCLRAKGASPDRRADPSTHLAASSSKMDAGALMRLLKNDTHPIGTPVIVTFTQP